MESECRSGVKIHSRTKKHLVMISKGSGSACFNVFLLYFCYLGSFDKTCTHTARLSELKITLTQIVNLSSIQFASAAPVSHPEINTTTHHSPLLTLQPASKGLRGAGGSMAGVPVGWWPFVKERSTRQSLVLTVSAPDTPAGATLP